MLHWKWCKTYGFETDEKLYEHFVGKEMRVLENDKTKVLRGFSTQTETKIDHNKPDLILLKKGGDMLYSRCCMAIWPTNREKRRDNVKNYTDLKYEILNM